MELQRVVSALQEAVRSNKSSRIVSELKHKMYQLCRQQCLDASLYLADMSVAGFLEEENVPFQNSVRTALDALSLAALSAAGAAEVHRRAAENNQTAAGFVTWALPDAPNRCLACFGLLLAEEVNAGRCGACPPHSGWQ